uniref:Uncharacterized protein n=1 Tax=Meloidogyne enterolobii TaxID=390850 RepID=A0A6V7U095_MELEN|nr:unnamed protein product [Meloidogyne enterolobii]
MLVRKAVIFVLVCVSIIALLILIGVIFLSANITTGSILVIIEWDVLIKGSVNRGMLLGEVDVRN